MNTKTQTGTIKLKIILGFGVALIIILIAGFITWKNLSQLTSSINLLSSPNGKLTELKEVMTKLTETESSVRAYTLTKDEKYLNTFNQLIDDIDESIYLLKAYTAGDVKGTNQVDSILKLVDEKKIIYAQFIQMKNDFNVAKSKVSKNILKKMNGTTQEKNDTAAEKKKSVIQSTLKKLFGSSAKKEKPKTDSSDVTTIVETVQHEENKLSLTNQQKEFQLLQRDSRVMDSIRAVITNMERNETNTSIIQAQEAKLSSDRAVMMLSAIAAAGCLIMLLFLYFIFNDIGRSNRYKKELIEERNKAEKLASVKEEFLSNMSHEIRTPLNSIVGFTEQLSQTNLDAKQADYLKVIDKSSDHLLSIVNEILDFSKIEAGKLEIEKAPFRCSDVIKEVYELLRHEAGRKNIILSYSVSEELENTILIGDSYRLKQILINLIGNGIKFTEKGIVEINCAVFEENDDEVKIEFEICDSGIGIPKENLSSIFDSFTQGSNGSSKKFGGTGLGLAISRRLVEIQNGSLQVLSSVGKGSVFTVIIPYKKANENVRLAVTNKKSELSTGLKGKLILVVDDEDMNLLLAKIILDKWGVTTDTAADGKTALQLLNERKYDAVLMDIQMPETGGKEITEMLRAGNSTNRNTPVIALTANALPENREKFLHAGMNDVLLKPFHEKDLYRKLMEAFHPDSAGKEEPPVTFSQNGNGQQAYSLEVLEETLGANKEFVLSMVESFIANSNKNLPLLKQYLNDKEWESLGKTAHKMIPSYRYLGVKKGEEPLKRIEQLALYDKTYNEIPGLVGSVTQLTEQVINDLGNEIKSLKDELRT